MPKALRGFPLVLSYLKRPSSSPLSPLTNSQFLGLVPFPPSTMATTETLTPADRIQKTFDDLGAEKTLMDACTLQWKSVSDHFAALSKTLGDRSQAIDSKIQALQSKTEETIASLDLHETAIPDTESALAASIESKKEKAIKDMEEAERKTPTTKGEFLRLYCRRMDSSNLWRFMIAHRKDLVLLRKEIAEAISESVDACRLVIDAVDDFLNHGESVEGGGDRCWAIGMLLRALFDSEGRKGPVVSEKIKERATEIAAEWRKRMGGKGEGGDGEGEVDGDMRGAEVQIFLQMVVAVGLSSKFEEEELRKVVLEHASRKEMAKLAAGLQLGEKMADIIDALVKSGKELEAVCFACEAGLVEKFAPALLLKNHLQNAKKKSQTILRSGNHSVTALEESTNVELNALRSLIKCVEYYKLESKFNIDGHKKRLTNLEKAEAERKKSAAATKSQTKRARPAGNASSFRPPKAVRTAGATYAGSFHRPSAMHQLPPTRYNYPIQGGGYDGSAPATYGTAHSRSPSTIRQQYYSGPSSVNYSGYDYGIPHTAPAQPQYPH